MRCRTPKIRKYAMPLPEDGVLKRWTGSEWIKATLFRWTGVSWVAAVLKRWTGSSWGTVDTTGV